MTSSSTSSTLALPAPRPYFPLTSGRYVVEAGLKILGQQPVEGLIESEFFPIDAHYGAYLSEKRASRRQLARHYATHRLPPALARGVADWLMDRLVLESPQFFQRDGWVFRNLLAGFEAEVDPEGLTVAAFRLLTPLIPEAQGDAVNGPTDFTGADLLDFLASQLSEDVALTCRDRETGENWLSLLHVSFPNHWAPEEKIGKPFMAVHEPVADFERIARASEKLIDAMITKGPFIRFAWGIATDTRLNHHPELPQGRKLEGEALAALGEHAFMRIERQTLKGFPEHDTAFFTIRTTFRSIADVAGDPVQREHLREAIATMSPDALVYKGLKDLQAPLVRFLS